MFQSNSCLSYFLVTFIPDLYLVGKNTKQHSKVHIQKHLHLLHSFHQFISEPTHLLPHPNSSIDLIFTDQPNLVINYSTHSSFNFKCHHQIIYCKLNPNTEYHPPYQQLDQDYKKAHINSVEANKLVTFNYHDPPSINYFLKNKIKWKHQTKRL